MKNILIAIGLLLTLKAYCGYDTVKLIATKKTVKPLSKGTWVSHHIPIYLDSGYYVLLLDDLPKSIKDSNIIIRELNGLSVLALRCKRSKNMTKNERDSWSKFTQVEDEIAHTLELIKNLDSEEKQLIEWKKISSRTNIISNYKDYYHEQGTIIRKKRLEAYQNLLLLRNQLSTFSSSFKASEETKAKGQLFVTVQVDNTIKDKMEVSYLIEVDSNALKKKRKIEFPYALNGRVVENIGRNPIPFAEVKFMKEKTLLSTTSTDLDGKFNIDVPQAGNYKLVILYSGYQKKKIKNFMVSHESVPKKLITMDLKQKTSFLDIMSYAIPLVDVMATFIR